MHGLVLRLLLVLWLLVELLLDHASTYLVYNDIWNLLGFFNLKPAAVIDLVAWLGVSESYIGLVR